jgi:hypothetical protein
MKNSLQNRLNALLFLFLTGCASDDNGFELSTATAFSTIYFGTSSHKLYAADNDLKIIQFVQLNGSNLIADMAKGRGNYLETLADLLAIKEANKAAFYAMSKQQFTHLLPSPDTTPAQLVFNLKTQAAKL